MPFIEFSKLPSHTPNPGRTASQLVGAEVQVNHLRFTPGSGSAEHAHPEEQFAYVVRGRFRITSGGEERVVGPGQAVIHPPNIPHQVTALEDGELISVKAVHRAASPAAGS